jgi:photosystem II stability/assembly factor-like uncharacterized protein
MSDCFYCFIRHEFLNVGKHPERHMTEQGDPQMSYCPLKLIAAAVLVYVFAQTSVADWQMTSGPAGGQVLCFKFIGDTVLAGTGGNGCYRSTDHGETWKYNALGSCNVTAFAENDSFLFAGVTEINASSGLYRSTDNGETWEWLYAGSGIKFGGVYSIYTKGDTVFIGSNSKGIYRSLDNGVTWDSTIVGCQDNGLIAGFVSDGTALYAATSDDVFKSTDWGETWEACGAGRSIDAISIHDGTLYAFGYDMYSSTDDGESWTTTEYPDEVIDVFGATFVDDDLFVGTRSAVFRYAGDGDSWTKILKDSMVQTLTVDKGTLFAGTRNGVFTSTDKGETWSESSTGIMGLTVSSLLKLDGKLFASTPRRQLYTSTDGGFTWEPFECDLPETMPAPPEWRYSIP